MRTDENGNLIKYLADEQGVIVIYEGNTEWNSPRAFEDLNHAVVAVINRLCQRVAALEK